MITPMPSPNNTNREQLYILRGEKGAVNPRGAYDGRRGLAYDTLGASPNDNIDQIVAWAKENLMPQNLHDLSQKLLAAAYRAGYPTPGSMADAEDDEPTVAGKSPAARLGADSASLKGVFARFPDLARIGRA
jgi:hypothetical protein